MCLGVQRLRTATTTRGGTRQDMGPMSVLLQMRISMMRVCYTADGAGVGVTLGRCFSGGRRFARALGRGISGQRRGWLAGL